MEVTTIKQQLKKEDKSGLGYIINYLDHNNPAAIYWDTYLKKDLFKIIMRFKNTKWHKLAQLKPYQKFF